MPKKLVIIPDMHFGTSIDDAVVEAQSTFVARTILPWKLDPFADWINRLGLEMGVPLQVEVDYGDRY